MNQFGLKELYEVAIKATYPIEFGNRIIEPGEIIARFDDISISNFNEVKQVITANGGWDNRAHIWWTTTKEVDLTFTQGVFSKEQFALLSGAKMLHKSPLPKPILIPNREIKESNEECEIILDKIPATKIFVYEKTTGNKIEFTQITNKKILLCCPFTDVIIDYDYEYKKDSTEIIVGQELTSGFLELQGKTKIKDDETGIVKTGILHIPKMKLMSNLSIQLGQGASPVVGRLDAIACPVGAKGKQKVMDIFFLEEDVDSDM